MMLAKMSIQIIVYLKKQNIIPEDKKQRFQETTVRPVLHTWRKQCWEIPGVASLPKLLQEHIVSSKKSQENPEQHPQQASLSSVKVFLNCAALSVMVI